MEEIKSDSNIWIQNKLQIERKKRIDSYRLCSSRNGGTHYNSIYSYRFGLNR